MQRVEARKAVGDEITRGDDLADIDPREYEARDYPEDRHRPQPVVIEERQWPMQRQCHGWRVAKGPRLPEKDVVVPEQHSEGCQRSRAIDEQQSACGLHALTQIPKAARDHFAISWDLKTVIVWLNRAEIAACGLL